MVDEYGFGTLHLSNGHVISFMTESFPALRHGSPDQLMAVRIRNGGRALRWDALDEDLLVSELAKRHADALA